MGRSVREISTIRGTFIYIRGYITASCLPSRVWGCTEGLDQMNVGAEGQESLAWTTGWAGCLWSVRVPVVSNAAGGCALCHFKWTMFEVLWTIMWL